MGYFCEGVYFIRIEFSLVRKRADGSEKYGLGDLNEETQTSKCSNIRNNHHNLVTSVR